MGNSYMPLSSHEAVITNTSNFHPVYMTITVIWKECHLSLELHVLLCSIKNGWSPALIKIRHWAVHCLCLSSNRQSEMHVSKAECHMETSPALEESARAQRILIAWLTQVTKHPRKTSCSQSLDFMLSAQKDMLDISKLLWSIMSEKPLLGKKMPQIRLAQATVTACQGKQYN